MSGDYGYNMANLLCLGHVIPHYSLAIAANKAECIVRYRLSVRCKCPNLFKDNAKKGTSHPVLLSRQVGRPVAIQLSRRLLRQ